MSTAKRPAVSSHWPAMLDSEARAKINGPSPRVLEQRIEKAKVCSADVAKRHPWVVGDHHYDGGDAEATRRAEEALAVEYSEGEGVALFVAMPSLRHFWSKLSLPADPAARQAILDTLPADEVATLPKETHHHWYPISYHPWPAGWTLEQRNTARAVAEAYKRIRKEKAKETDSEWKEWQRAEDKVSTAKRTKERHERLNELANVQPRRVPDELITVLRGWMGRLRGRVVHGKVTRAHGVAVPIKMPDGSPWQSVSSPWTTVRIADEFEEADADQTSPTGLFPVMLEGRLAATLRANDPWMDNGTGLYVRDSDGDGDALAAGLAAFAADPSGVMGRAGKSLGVCVVCGRPLSDAESKKRGIGPVCAQLLGEFHVPAPAKKHKADEDDEQPKAKKTKPNEKKANKGKSTVDEKKTNRKEPSKRPAAQGGKQEKREKR